MEITFLSIIYPLQFGIHCIIIKIYRTNVRAKNERLRGGYVSCIFHIDVNSAFLSWEAAYRIHHLGAKVDLRKIPSAVGGSIEHRHGIILAKSIPSKRYDIQTGEPVTDAKRKCPDLVLVPPNYELYEKCSHAFMKILRNYTDVVEQYSIDEAFMDMSGTKQLLGDPIDCANRLKDEVYSKLGFTVNVGISENKLLAKMASDLKKPNRVHTLYREEIPNKMWPLPVRDLFFCGRATERKLHSLGIKTIGEIANSDIEILKFHMKKHGEIIWNYANVYDVSPVEPVAAPNKGYGNSTTIAFDVDNSQVATAVLLSLAESVGRRLRKDKKRIKLVSVGIRYSDLSYVSHQCVLTSATNITEEIWNVACKLFYESWNGMPVRHLGIHTSKVVDLDEGRQLSLFDQFDYQTFEKLEKLDTAVDEIRARFGTDAIMRATFLNQEKIDHVSGGISREKRTVDYSKIEVK